MKCRFCSKENLDDSKFCCECGRQLTTPEWISELRNDDIQCCDCEFGKFIDLLSVRDLHPTNWIAFPRNGVPTLTISFEIGYFEVHVSHVHEADVYGIIIDTWYEDSPKRTEPLIEKWNLTYDEMLKILIPNLPKIGVTW